MRPQFYIQPQAFEFEVDGSEAGFGEFERLEAELIGRVLTYTTRDVIDQRISIPAQHSLVRLSNNPATNADAVGLLEKVKAGRLGGIFCVNWQRPVQRAIRLGQSWWTVIPAGVDAVLLLDPENPLAGQPLIAFSQVLDRRHPAMRAAAKAYRRGFGIVPSFLRCGGTIPIVNLLQERLSIPTVLMGFALPDDQLHGPNEKIHLPTFFKSIATSIAFLEEIARLSRSTQERSPSNCGQAN